ncbi:MAG: TIGR02587 family membrane protein [Spongiibacteraceae bacterium]|nr:TIGR02587 family membrane protein [Spongiibacteraceae bacterium]
MHQETSRFWRAMGRASAGALLFVLPLLMTMEMWELGFYLDRLKIALLLVVLLPLLVGLSYFSGFKHTLDLWEDAIDALTAWVVGALLVIGILVLLAIVKPVDSFDAMAGKAILLTIPASIGAVIASKQLGQKDNGDDDVVCASYGGELFIMAAGALLLALNVAPTEEMVLIAYKMSVWHALLLSVFTLAIMHAMVYMLAFRGTEAGPDALGHGPVFYSFTIAGYAVALLVSAYVLWTFGRFEGSGLELNIMSSTVLAFPAGVGAAVSRLVL